MFVPPVLFFRLLLYYQIFSSPARGKNKKLFSPKRFRAFHQAVRIISPSDLNRFTKWFKPFHQVVCIVSPSGLKQNTWWFKPFHLVVWYKGLGGLMHMAPTLYLNNQVARQRFVAWSRVSAPVPGGNPPLPLGVRPLYS